MESYRNHLIVICALMLALAATARAGITPHAFNAGDSGGSAVSALVTTLPAATANNDIAVVAIACQTIQTITPPAGYTLANPPGATTFNTTETVSVFTHLWLTGDTTGPSFSIAVADTCSYVTAAYTGANVTTWLDSVGGSQTTASGTTYNAPTITTSNAGEELLNIYASNAIGAVCSAPSKGFFEKDIRGTQPHVCIADQGLGAAGVTGPRTITDGTGASVGLTMALIPANIPPIVFNGKASGNSGGVGATSVSVSLPASVANNDTVIVGVTVNNQAAITPPAGYTLILDQNNGSTTGHEVTYWHTWLTGDATSGLSFSWTGSNLAAWFSAAYTGAATAYSPIDVFGGSANAQNQLLSSPSIVPNYANEQILMIFGGIPGSAAVPTPPAPMTLGNIQVSQTGASNVPTYLVDTGFGAAGPTGVQPLLTNAGSQFSAGQQIGLLPAADATNTPTPTATATASTPTATATASTPTPTASTPTATATATATASTPTPTPTATATASTPTPTPTATQTPGPTSTPGPPLKNANCPQSGHGIFSGYLGCSP